MQKQEKFYITTSIAYTNSLPHIGYALELIQADVAARYNRLLGKNVWFLTGTDEHGSKIARAAKEAGKTPQNFCNEISIKFKELKAILDLSFDDFIRTTDQLRHWPVVHNVWQKLKENNDIYKKKYKGLYCVGCEAFLTEKDLIDGKCPNHKKEPEIIEEENYFFRLSKYQAGLKDILENDKIKIFPEAKKNEMLNFIKEGLEDVSCSRSKKKLQWGISVPDDANQVVYVWFEALINYLSALGYGASNSEKLELYWPPDIQVIGKDITRFHLLLWPAMLLSLGLSLSKSFLIHGYITVGGEKMSKSLGNVISPFELIEKYTQKIGNKEATIDAVRYFLLREISPTEDGDFTYEKFEGRYNSDLAAGIGNLVARVLAVAIKLNPKSGIRNPKPAKGEALRGRQIQNSKLQKETEKTKEKYEVAVGDFKFNEALGAIWELIGFCDKYINDEKPWENRENSKEVISNLLFIIYSIAEMLKPFMPQTAEKILEQIKTGSYKLSSESKSQPLFPRI
ncbi:methionine--tRNA ligase [bacterium (Candidatus Gribaldobacteria) CG08_land_8_20_14_0_20_39_15]|uniref:Methionine--tRNA ligase n=1 Tax=bacterium (Candidatus Gribaldobacteria) CG08_land_8_20_14_0_20_39_15 TaxID=2014273 RepID=A0A2M6XUC1_9BACT|nr:MAG: methionine--tRNA ligase [bacterium (Candidatus Gribaldobacteria) CG08_land_8_20_14_0_20_39_15]